MCAAHRVQRVPPGPAQPGPAVLGATGKVYNDSDTRQREVFMPKLLDRKARRDEAYEANRDHWLNELRIIEAQRRTIAEGGGEKAAARQRKHGKLLARERVETLIDDGSEFLELGSFAAWEIYEEWGGAPGAGVVTGLGKVSGRECVVVANDATVKAGAWFPLTCKKILRAQDFSLENRLPIIYLCLLYTSDAADDL